MQGELFNLAPSQSNGPIQSLTTVSSSVKGNGDGRRFSSPATCGSSGSSFRKVHVCVPPVLEAEVREKAAENPPAHPVWAKALKRSRYFVIPIDSLDDLTEVADFARVELEEPEHPLSKARRHAFQVLLGRVHRHAVLEPLGECHCQAVAWREQPLRNTQSPGKIVRELRETKVYKGLTSLY